MPNRHTGERGDLAAGDAPVGSSRLCQRDFRTQVEKGIQIFVAFDAIQVKFREFERRDLSGRERAAEFGH